MFRFSWWLRWYRICLQCGRPELIPGLGRSLEKGMATHSSTLAWESPWTEEPCGRQSTGLQELDMAERLTLRLSLFHLVLVPCHALTYRLCFGETSQVDTRVLQSKIWVAVVGGGLIKLSILLSFLLLHFPLIIHLSQNTHTP